jgi:hypothetical protein
MNNVVTIGKRLIPLEQIAFVEPFNPASNPDFKSDRPFKARVVMLNRDTVLTESATGEFAEHYGFRMLGEESVAVNPNIGFRVETFTPTESFKPEKPYATRLKWRDLEGNEHSKLLLTKPETVIAVVVRREAEPSPDGKKPPWPVRASPQRRGARKLQAARS